MSEYGTLVNRIVAGLAGRAAELEGAPLVVGTAWAGRVHDRWERARREGEAWEKEIGSVQPPTGHEAFQLFHWSLLEGVKGTVLGHRCMQEAVATAALYYLGAHQGLYAASTAARLLRSQEAQLYARLNLSRDVERQLLGTWGDPEVGLELGIF
jgi:hypothetical protein